MYRYICVYMRGSAALWIAKAGHRESASTRYRRKLREARQTAVEHHKQPGLTISVRQPEKMSLLAWPSLPQFRAWLQHLRQSWRVLTCGREHAELWLEKATELAQKTRGEAEFWSKLEIMTCDIADYATAVEKLALELVAKFDDKLQRELAVLREKRRQQGGSRA